MKKPRERIATFLIDFLSINVAYILYYFIRVRSGWISYTIEPDTLLPLLIIYFYWIICFLLFGLYRPWYEQSRLDEVLTIVRACSIGILFLFFLIFIDDSTTGSTTHSRLLIIVYWVLLIVFVTAGRFILRFTQRKLLLSGIGLRDTIIVGWSDKAFQLCEMVVKYPALGYRMKGFVMSERQKSLKGRSKSNSYKGIPVIGSVHQLSDLISRNHIRTVLVGLDSTEHGELLEVIHQCDRPDVSVRIMPDLYDIVSGQARISSIYGLPLMEIHPQLLKPWEELAKRSLDVFVSFIILLIMLPFWILLPLLIKISSKGPVLYKQTRVGKQGKHFKMLKFRSMKTDAEKQTGPVWAGKNDPRVTAVGRILRKTHLDELPQFINVLVGEMSLVGPRPERPFFVDKLSREIPLYRHRLRVRPGITGWAQIKHKYDESIDDVRAKVKYDLFYIENISWRLDLKILFNTLFVMVMGKGHA